MPEIARFEGRRDIKKVAPSDSDFQSFKFSSADFQERDRIEAFIEILARTILRIETSPVADQPLYIDMSMRGARDLGIAVGTASPMRNKHVAERADNDDLVLVVVQGGVGVAEQRGREATVSDGQAVLTANGEAGTFTGHSETRLVNFRLKRSLLAPKLADTETALIQPIRADMPALRLLLSYAGVVNEEGLFAVPEIVNHMHDLAALVIGATQDAAEEARGRGVRAARLRAIKADVRNSYASPVLSVSAVASRQGVTPRYVQLLFEKEGTTFSEFVLGERLICAFRMLVNRHYQHLKVSEIAYRCGFSDLSHFNRCFRRRFGDTPSGVRHGQRG